jgi:hypothetical protein
MNSQDFCSLQEAYLEVYEENAETPVERTKRRDRSSGMSTRDRLLRHRLQRGMKKGQDGREAAERQYEEQYDLYDIILSHLLDEGYAKTPEAAEVMMVNMSEDWRESIVEENMKKSPRNIEKAKQKAKQRKDRRLRIQYYGKDAVGHGTGEDLRPSSNH